MHAEVFASNEQDDHPVELPRWTLLAEQVLEAEGVTVDAEVSLLFVDERTIADLHQRFMGKPGPTDVLSFPIDDEPPEPGRHPDAGGTGPGDAAEPDDLPMLLGDVVICPAVAAANAPAHAGTYDDELALLVVHGLLHLLGMDHEDEAEAEEMEGRERAHLARVHKPPPEGEELPPLLPRGPRGVRPIPARRAEAMTLERLQRGDLPSLRPDEDDG